MIAMTTNSSMRVKADLRHFRWNLTVGTFVLWHLFARPQVYCSPPILCVACEYRANPFSGVEGLRRGFFAA